MGRRHVVIQRERRNNTARNVQLDDIFISGFRSLEKPQDSAMAQYLIFFVLHYIHDYTVANSALIISMGSMVSL